MSDTSDYRPYFMTSGVKNFTDFWRGYLAEPSRKVMFVLGMGFDPRTLDCIRLIYKTTGNSSIRYRIIHYDNHDPGSKNLILKTDHNNKHFKQLVQESEWDKVKVRIDPSVDQATPADAFQNCIHVDELKEYTDFIVDISAMPPDVYFPILKKLLARTSSNQVYMDGGAEITHCYNVHVIASENATL